MCRLTITQLSLFHHENSELTAVFLLLFCSFASNDSREKCHRRGKMHIFACIARTVYANLIISLARTWLFTRCSTPHTKDAQRDIHLHTHTHFEMQFEHDLTWQAKIIMYYLWNVIQPQMNTCAHFVKSIYRHQSLRVRKFHGNAYVCVRRFVYFISS